MAPQGSYLSSWASAVHTAEDGNCYKPHPPFTHRFYKSCKVYYDLTKHTDTTRTWKHTLLHHTTQAVDLLSARGHPRQPHHCWAKWHMRTRGLVQVRPGILFYRISAGLSWVMSYTSGKQTCAPRRNASLYVHLVSVCLTFHLANQVTPPPLIVAQADIPLGGPIRLLRHLPVIRLITVIPTTPLGQLHMYLVSTK